MKLIVVLCTYLLFSIGCKDEPVINSSPLDLTNCFSPEFGLLEEEQFYYDIAIGEIELDLDKPINITNQGYTIVEGSKTIFVFRHFLENSFNIIDDEIEIRILFQIDEGLNSFLINSKGAFEAAKFVYAECGVALNQVEGEKSGVRNSAANWTVSADLDIQRFNAVIEISFDGEFIK